MGSLELRAALFASGAAVIFALGGWTSTTVTNEWCASGFPNRCAKSIRNAVAAPLVRIQEKIIPITVHDKEVVVREQQKLQSDLQRIDDTKDEGHTCAGSPAMRELRSQLRDLAPDPEAP